MIGKILCFFGLHEKFITKGYDSWKHDVKIIKCSRKGCNFTDFEWNGKELKSKNN